jgi:hypothetical protein
VATATGTVQLGGGPSSTMLTVKGSGPPVVDFPNPPDWVWKLVVGNAGAEVEVTYDEGPPAVIGSVKVG